MFKFHVDATRKEKKKLTPKRYFVSIWNVNNARITTSVSVYGVYFNVFYYGLKLVAHVVICAHSTHLAKFKMTWICSNYIVHRMICTCVYLCYCCNRFDYCVFQILRFCTHSMMMLNALTKRKKKEERAENKMEWRLTPTIVQSSD